MNRIMVIGVGPGSGEMLTLQAMGAINTADVVFCADRNAPLAPVEKRRPLVPFGAAMDSIARTREEGRRAAVLVSGDAGLYSMLAMLSKRFGAESLCVIPGISSPQALCAALAVGWQDAKILSAHGRALSASALCHHARTNPKTLVLLDGERDPHWVRQALDAGGLDALPLIVGENLTCPGQAVGPYENRPYVPLCVALITNDAPETGLPPIGVDDDAFLRGKTPMTKKEIRAQVIASLRLAPDAVVWDVGAGTGSVTIECARQCPLGNVFAIEKEEEARALIARNSRRFHALNVEIVAGRAPEALSGLPAPTHVFLGGTGGETGEILALLEGLNARIRLCATAVTMETASLCADLLSRYADFSAAQISVSRLERTGRYRMFRAQNPVFLFSATMEGKV